MVRATFAKKLRSLGEVPTPEGHVRQKRGMTNYFFANDRRHAVEALLAAQELADQGQHKMYVEGVRFWQDADHDRVVQLCTHEDFFTVTICHWPS